MSPDSPRRAPLFRLTNTIQQAFVETLPDVRIRLRRDASVISMEVPTADALPPECLWTGSLHDHLAPDDAARWLAVIARCLDTREVQTDTQRAEVFGRPLDFEVRVTADGDDAVVAIARDISARQEALRRLEANHRLVTAIAQSFPGCLYVIETRSWRPVYVNRALPELLGHDRLVAELTLAEQITRLARPEARADIDAHVRAILHAREDETQEIELALRDAAGAWRTVLVRSKVFSRHASGRVQDIFCIVEDITDRKLAQERLRHGQKLELLGQLAGVVVHDFNNIITSVRGFAELLVEDLPADSPAAEDARIIRAGMERAAGVARRLLAFSRNDASRPRVVDLGEALLRMTPLLRGAVGERYRVEVSTQPEVRALIDPVDLEQCVLNLVLNARDATPQGGVVEVTLDTASRAERPVARIAVRDHGTGVDPRVRDRLFEAFFTTKASGVGTGLGLASVQRVMAAAQGTVEVESVVGEGATFTLVLPRVEGVEPRDDTPRMTHAPRPLGARVLVVEDDALVRRLVVDSLRRDGNEVRSADDAVGALAIARDERFDVIVSDVVLPGTSGPAMVAQLRAIDPALRVLFVSGYYETAEADPRQVEGARLLLKPFGADDLLNALRDVLSDTVATA